MAAKEEILVTLEMIPNEDGGPFAAVVEDKPDQRGTERKQDTLKTPVDRPKSRRKIKTTKKLCELIELSDESQEVKRKEVSNLAEDTSPAPKADEIEKFLLANGW
ncbi:hypothetical protein R1flu_019583 [Riccia fluitans]|uniref:Uncharacterized protein n=1 Tax=Riccia fluitans TaxID=41844 RepID=A0ABD1ZKI3_9MARC